MTKDDYNLRLSALRDAEFLLRAEYRSSAPIKVGDEVFVIGDGVGRVSEVVIEDDGDLWYTVFAEKWTCRVPFSGGRIILRSSYSGPITGDLVWCKVGPVSGLHRATVVAHRVDDSGVATYVVVGVLGGQEGGLVSFVARCRLLGSEMIPDLAVVCDKPYKVDDPVYVLDGDSIVCGVVKIVHDDDFGGGYTVFSDMDHIAWGVGRSLGRFDHWGGKIFPRL